MQPLPVAYRNRAKRLTIDFTDVNSLPSRFKPGSKSTRVSVNSNIEEEFQTNLKGWESLILTMMDNSFPQESLERLIFLRLDPDDPFESVSENEQFCQNLDYLTFRRNECQCDDDELGKLSMLCSAYQKVIEKHLKKSVSLKDDLAQQLKDQQELRLKGFRLGFSGDTIEKL